MSRPARILLSCGEPSGDLYGAELVRHLRSSLPSLEVFGLGGDRLSAEGAHLVAHVRDLAVVGLVEVVKHLKRIRGIYHAVLSQVDRGGVDLAVLVDYPDFNLRLARALRARGVRVVYYVSPQLWAWRSGRMSLVRETVARMLVIFPFEQALYEAAGVPVTFVGHPLLDLVRPEADRHAFLSGCGLHPDRPLVAVLPGSRPQEVAHNLPALAAAVKTMAESRPDLQFALAGAPSLPPELFAPFRQPHLPVVFGRTHGLVGAAELALVASGTATVETAILGTPMIVVYRLSRLTYWLGRRFVKVDQFAMVNLIAGRPVVQELIQNDFTPARLAHEGLRLLGDPERLQRMRADLVEVKGRLGGGGASGRAAATVLQELALVRSDIDRREATV